jgi:NADPH-dependent curcumin reductase CurA
MRAAGAALDACNVGGRMVICGAISGYNSRERYEIKVRPIFLVFRLIITCQMSLCTEHDADSI